MILRIRVHNNYQTAANRFFQNLSEKIKKTEIKYPGKGWTIFYELR
ncbi:MAG: hypothetical protein ACQESN_08170 [Thermotogota bacterium]